MRMQSERQKNTTALSISFFFSGASSSASLQLCLVVVRQANTSDTWFIHLQLHSQVKCHHISARVVPPDSSPGAARAGCAWWGLRLRLPGRGPVGIGWVVLLLTSPSPVLGAVYPPHPGSSAASPCPPVPSSGCEGTLARAPPAGPPPALRRPTIPGWGAPWRSGGQETAGAAQVTRGSLVCPLRCSPGAVRKDGLVWLQNERRRKKKKKTGKKHKTAQLGACGGRKKKTDTNRKKKKKARVKIKFPKKRKKKP